MPDISDNDLFAGVSDDDLFAGMDAQQESQQQQLEPTAYNALNANMMGLPEDAGTGRAMLAKAGDISSNILSIPSAAGAQLDRLIAGKEPQSFWKTLIDIKQGRTAEGEESLARKIISDPTNVPMIAAGGPLAKGGYQVGTNLAANAPKWLQRLAPMLTVGAGEGIVSSTGHQAEKFAKTGDVDLGEAAIETGLSAVLPTGIQQTLKGGNVVLGRLASSLSGVSEEALRMFGTGMGKGASKLKDIAGKVDEVGESLLNAIDNADDFLPEKALIDDALSNMPKIETAPIVDRLRKSLIKNPIGKSKEVNEGIIEIINQFKEMPFMDAVDIRGIKRQLDDQIGDAFGEVSAGFVTALKSARNQAKESLIKAGEGTEYGPLMRDYAKKIGIIEKVKDLIGKKASSRENRVESFVSTMFGKNKKARQKAVKDVSDIFGKDFLEQSKLSTLSAELGEEGVPGLLPRQFTGRSGLGLGMSATGAATGINPLVAAVPAALSSPRIASGTLGFADLLEKGAKETLPIIGQPLRSATFRDDDTLTLKELNGEQ